MVSMSCKYLVGFVLLLVMIHSAWPRMAYVYISYEDCGELNSILD